MYKLTAQAIVLRLSDGASIPLSNESADYREYLEWLSAGNEALAADVEQITPHSTTPLEFIERFTGTEQLAIVTAAMASPALRLWYDKLMAAQEVVFDDPRLSAGLDAMVAAGLLTEARRNEVLE